jgi:uncharacterized protein YqhQ
MSNASKIISTRFSNTVTPIAIPDATAKEKEDNYKSEREKNSHVQQEALKRTFHVLASVILYILGVSVAILLLVRLFILIAPTEYHWLTVEKIEKIDQLFNYIIVGSVGTSVLKYFQKNIKLE